MSSVEGLLILVSYFGRESGIKDLKIIMFFVRKYKAKLHFALKVAYLIICISWQDFQCRATIQELNAIPSILELLKSEYPIIQLLALKTLGVITNDKESRAMLRDSQGMDLLIKILETKVYNIHSTIYDEMYVS